jgi:hypothetical protein
MINWWRFKIINHTIHTFKLLSLFALLLWHLMFSRFICPSQLYVFINVRQVVCLVVKNSPYTYFTSIFSFAYVVSRFSVFLVRRAINSNSFMIDDSILIGFMIGKVQFFIVTAVNEHLNVQ